MEQFEEIAAEVEYLELENLPPEIQLQYWIYIMQLVFVLAFRLFVASEDMGESIKFTDSMLAKLPLGTSAKIFDGIDLSKIPSKLAFANPELEGTYLEICIGVDGANFRPYASLDNTPLLFIPAGTRLQVSHVTDVNGVLFYGVSYPNANGDLIPGFVHQSVIGTCATIEAQIPAAQTEKLESTSFASNENIDVNQFITGPMNMRLVNEYGEVIYPGVIAGKLGSNGIPYSLPLYNDPYGNGYAQTSRQHDIDWVLAEYDGVRYAIAYGPGPGYGTITPTQVANPTNVGTSVTNVGNYGSQDLANGVSAPHEGFYSSLAAWTPNSAIESQYVWVYLIGNNPNLYNDAADVLGADYGAAGILITINGTVFRTTSEYIYVAGNAIAENQFASYPFAWGSTWVKFSLNNGAAVLQRIEPV